MCHTLCVTSPSGLYFFSACVGPSEVFLACSTFGKPKKLNFKLCIRLKEELTEKFMKGPVWCVWPVVLKMSLRTLTFNFG